MPAAIQLNQCLWVYGEAIYRSTPNARPEIDALKPRGAETFMLKHHAGRDDFAALRRRLWQDDAHVILTRLHPKELAAIQPILRERKNFSIACDDWCIVPHWFMRHAEYVILRLYNGLAVRLAGKPWTQDSPPLLYNPWDSPSTYSFAAAGLRLPALAAAPLVNAINYFRRRGEDLNPARYLYFPHAVVAGDLPLKRDVEFKYDFGNTGAVCGIWIMRDPFVPFHHTFANLYCDRLRLMRLIQSWEGQPFTFFHNQGKAVSWNEYVERSTRCRFVINTGGLQGNLGPKFLEYACLGIPMIGRSVPYAAPWLDECLFPVDIMHTTREQLKPLLHEALERHSELRNNCLKWRDRLFQLHDPHVLLDMLQGQIDGNPIPPGYLKVDFKNLRTQT